MIAVTLDSYLKTFDKLRLRRNWSANGDMLRISALCLATLDLEEPEEELEGTAAELRRRAGWTSPLRSSIRYAIAAMILRREANAARVHAEVKRIRRQMRKLRLPRGGKAEVFAAFLLSLEHDGKRVAARTMRRMREIHTRWADDHPYITGVDDYPMAALHAMRDEDPSDIGVRVEAIYQELRAAGFGLGNQLQLASHILAMSPWGAEAAAGRFLALVWSFKDNDVKIQRRHFDEVAILSLTHAPPATLAKRVVRNVERLRAVKPKPSRDIAFSISSGIALANDSRSEVSPGGQMITATAVDSLLQAQQAAIIASICVSSTIAHSNC